MKYTTAADVAKYFIGSFQRKNKEISNLKLQKLLYYAQAWYLALYGSALFKDPIEAWVHGPVVPSVFREYKAYGWRPISKEIQPNKLQEFSPHLREVMRVYGDFDAVTLERMTHRESPWKEARGHLAPDEPSYRIITPESMKNFYRARRNG